MYPWFGLRLDEQKRVEERNDFYRVSTKDGFVWVCTKVIDSKGSFKKKMRKKRERESGWRVQESGKWKRKKHSVAVWTTWHEKREPLGRRGTHWPPSTLHK